jgi:hypothetical protein
MPLLSTHLFAAFSRPATRTELFVHAVVCLLAGLLLAAPSLGVYYMG